MPFLQDADYKDAIKGDVLLSVIDGDTAARTQAESKAQAYITGYLSNRYDTVEMFSKTGNDREVMLIHLMVHASLFYLHQRINPKMIPETRKDNWDEVKQLLNDIADGKINYPTWPRKTDSDDENESGRRYGGNEKMEHRW